MEFVPLDLAGVAALGGGRIDYQFAAAIERVIAAVRDLEAQRAGGAWAKGEVLIRVVVEGRAEDDGGAVSVTATVESKTPKMRGAAAVLRRDPEQGWGHDQDRRQTILFEEVTDDRR